MPTFISEPIEPHFEQETIVKSRAVLTGFTWRERRFAVTKIMQKWEEKSPPRWKRHGSRQNTRWHVSTFGRVYYRVAVAPARIFELYYDRAMEGKTLTGRWILWRELEPADLSDWTQPR